MINTQTLISVIAVLLVTVPTLLILAFVTIAERKTMASMQSKYSPVFNFKFIIFIFKVYYKLSHALSFAYCLHIDYDVFNIFKSAFICF